MTKWTWWVGVGMLATVIGAVSWPSRAQSGPAGPARPTVQEAMLRPYPWSYREETTLQKVADDLHRTLGAPVALDRAALTRKKITPESTVRLELEGVRLKTGLKLLLDHVGLTTHVVPEDNLLILTDAEGSDDPATRALAEVQSLHRDLHDVQTDLADLRDFLGANDGAGPVLRKPTILEEVPADGTTGPRGGNHPAPESREMPEDSAPSQPRKGI